LLSARVRAIMPMPIGMGCAIIAVSAGMDADTISWILTMTALHDTSEELF